MNIDDLIATAQPRTEKVRICARGDLVASHMEAVAALQKASSADDSLSGSEEMRAAAAAVKAIEDEQEAATVEFTVSAVSRNVWADLLAKNPPSKTERRAGLDHDPKSFPAAAIAACVIEPELTEDQAVKLGAALPSGEWNKLWVTTYGLNILETPSPKLPAATALLQANEPSSTTSDPEGSLAGPSSAGSGVQSPPTNSTRPVATSAL